MFANTLNIPKQTENKKRNNKLAEDNVTSFPIGWMLDKQAVSVVVINGRKHGTITYENYRNSVILY